MGHRFWVLLHYMLFDLCYVFALPSEMRYIRCNFCSESLFWPVFVYIIPQQPQKL